MRTLKVRLYIRIRLSPGRYAFTEPVWNRNRTLREGYASIQGEPEAHPEGQYYLRYLCRGKRRWQALGKSADRALAAFRNTEHDLEGVALGRRPRSSSSECSAHEPTGQGSSTTTTGLDEAASPHADPGGPAREPNADGLLEDAIDSYLADVRQFRMKKTIAAYERILGILKERYSDKTLRGLTRKDLLDHRAALEAQGLSPRTVFNHLDRIKTFLRAQGVVGLLKTGDMPAYDEPEVEAYDADQLGRLFAAANPGEWLLFQFFLKTGLREQEVMFCTWKNIDFKGKVIKVRTKRRLGFRVKDKEERSVPVPDDLIAALAARKSASASVYLFPTEDGLPNGHFLRLLKKRALEAGLNCGECINKAGQSCRTRPICEDWVLHKFRKTFATMHNEAGIPASTIQRWLGHEDLSTTLRYLAIADLRSDRTRQQVNATFASLGHRGA